MDFNMGTATRAGSWRTRDGQRKVQISPHGHYGSRAGPVSPQKVAARTGLRKFLRGAIGRHGRGRDAAWFSAKQVCLLLSVLNQAQPTAAAAEPAAVLLYHPPTLPTWD